MSYMKKQRNQNWGFDIESWLGQVVFSFHKEPYSTQTCRIVQGWEFRQSLEKLDHTNRLDIFCLPAKICVSSWWLCLIWQMLRHTQWQHASMVSMAQNEEHQELKCHLKLVKFKPKIQLQSSWWGHWFYTCQKHWVLSNWLSWCMLMYWL